MNAGGSIVGQLNASEKSEVIREAYRKHAAELQDIDNAQIKTTLAILAILGAGGTFVSAAASHLNYGAKIGLTILVVAVVTVGFLDRWRRNNARAGTRNLLVKCEEALGFYDAGTYLAGETLYPAGLKTTYKEEGRWLGWIYLVVIGAGIGFLVILWTLST